MIHADLLEILRCPVCVQDKTKGGVLQVHQDTWLLCTTCDRKYPIVDDIPVMLVPEGDKWVGTAVSGLPIPPPALD